jgi:ATP-dependent Clp protease ATP-binding subunit ClpX
MKAMPKCCSFCGITEEESLLIEGVKACICKDCASLSVEAFAEMEDVQLLQNHTFLKPHEIKAELDKYIIGQEEAKKILSVAVYNHYKRIHSKSKVEIQKSNVLLIGPTGSGKTYLMQTLSKILNVPLAIVDATSLTEAGYVGEDVESILEKLLQKADGDIKKAERGIVYIDEIDKIASKTTEGRKDTRDISGQGVQEALLKMIEGSEVAIDIGNSHWKKQKVIINTKNILFVCGGAFVGIQDIAKKRLDPNKKSIGFTVPSDSDVQKNQTDYEITHEDVIEFGFIPEFVGRLPVIAVLNPLTKKELADILVKPKNSIIKQYQALFRMDGVRLKFHQNAIDFIVEEAMKKKIGARGLKSVIEKRMYDIMFELPKQKDIKTFTITKEILMNKSSV